MAQKILVIEDEISVLQNTVEMLSLEGFDVEGAENGRLGVECAVSTKPDLIICDIMMPEMSGYEVLAELRENPTTALTPFIFLTARTERRDMRQGMNLGADDYLTKPFTVAELLESVYTRLGRREAIEGFTEQKLEDLRESILLSMPHEMRTPLTSILGFSDIMAMDARQMEPDQVESMAVHINRAAIRLSHVVENYLAFAQTEIIRLDPKRLANLRQMRTRDTKSVIEETANRVASHYDRSADLQLDVEGDAVAFHEDFLKKTVEELIDNAFKFSEPGTPVMVRAASSGDLYRIEIKDQGRGMTAEQISDVGAFMQFERAFYEQQGCGLGLVISHRLIELHQGTLSIESEHGKGLAVMIRLPRA